MGKFFGIRVITLSNHQLVKTYKEVIRINSELYRYLKYMKVDRFYKDKPNIPPKLLALTDKPYSPPELLALTQELEKNLIDFGDEKDLIEFGEDPIVIGKEKDLIDFDTIIPPPKPTPQELLMDEELFPKEKKYKVLQNKDLIPTSTNPSTNGVNILKKILNYSETKRILGISLTSDLK